MLLLVRMSELSQRRNRATRGAALMAVASLSWGGCASEQVQPAAGVVVEHAEPKEVCAMNVATKLIECHWKYWLYVDGCAALPPEIQAHVKEQNSDYTPQKGWVSVNGDTYAETPDGSVIVFQERNWVQRITGQDNAQSCTP